MTKGPDPRYNHKRKFGLTLAELEELSREEREEFAREHSKPVFYFKSESRECRAAAEEAVLSAAPRGHDLAALNGVNVGAGARPVSKFLTAVDLKRAHKKNQATGSFLAPMMPLPFKPNVVDYIVSLHSLEHIPNPVQVVMHWLYMIKPGGGIGLILPDWRYSWDARNDKGVWGHKWNSEPKVLKNMYERHFQDHCDLEALDTYDWKISFDVVLRKRGDFVPFDSAAYLVEDSGKKMNDEGRFVSDLYQ